MESKILGMRLTKSMIDKIDNISRKTCLTKREIVSKWIEGTTVDEAHKEFKTICTSGK